MVEHWSNLGTRPKYDQESLFTAYAGSIYHFTTFKSAFSRTRIKSLFEFKYLHSLTSFSMS